MGIAIIARVGIKKKKKYYGPSREMCSIMHKLEKIDGQCAPLIQDTVIFDSFIMLQEEIFLYFFFSAAHLVPR